MPCAMSLLIYIIVLLLVCISLSSVPVPRSNLFAFLSLTPFKTCLLTLLYHKDCTTTRQSQLFSIYVVINSTQDEMKLENIWSKLQPSFVLLQFVCFICFMLHNNIVLPNILVEG